LQEGIPNPERVAGMHFFNPAQIMKLVEVVKAKETSDAVIETIMAVCKQLKKTAVLCIDAPGFIVNRVARHYYLEAMKLVEQDIATFETVDEVMEASGFKMGPFKLMDLIGMDINLAVSTSLYEAFDHEPRFEPSAIQINKVKKGELGKKTGVGFYQY
jgi:3-hydroxybutyryl-CoA dehydrogenase